MSNISRESLQQLHDSLQEANKAIILAEHEAKLHPVKLNWSKVTEPDQVGFITKEMSEVRIYKARSNPPVLESKLTTINGKRYFNLTDEERDALIKQLQVERTKENVKKMGLMFESADLIGPETYMDTVMKENIAERTLEQQPIEIIPAEVMTVIYNQHQEEEKQHTLLLESAMKKLQIVEPPTVVTTTVDPITNKSTTITKPSEFKTDECYVCGITVEPKTIEYDGRLIGVIGWCKTCQKKEEDKPLFPIEDIVSTHIEDLPSSGRECVDCGEKTDLVVNERYRAGYYDPMPACKKCFNDAEPMPPIINPPEEEDSDTDSVPPLVELTELGKKTLDTVLGIERLPLPPSKTPEEEERASDEFHPVLKQLIKHPDLFQAGILRFRPDNKNPSEAQVQEMVRQMQAIGTGELYYLPTDKPCIISQPDDVQDVYKAHYTAGWGHTVECACKDCNALRGEPVIVNKKHPAQQIANTYYDHITKQISNVIGLTEAERHEDDYKAGLCTHGRLLFRDPDTVLTTNPSTLKMNITFKMNQLIVPPVKVGQVWQHYRNSNYEIIAIAIDADDVQHKNITDDTPRTIVYKALYEDDKTSVHFGQVFVRSHDSFIANVGTYPELKTRYSLKYETVDDFWTHETIPVNRPNDNRPTYTMNDNGDVVMTASDPVGGSLTSDVATISVVLPKSSQ